MKRLILVLIVLCEGSILYSQHSTGLIFSDEKAYEAVEEIHAGLMGTLPSRVDLSEWFPSPGDQGDQGSCVGWAVGYGLKSFHEAKESGIKPTMANRIFSPSYIYNQIKISHCGAGSSIYEALQLLINQGVASIQDFPYDESNCNRFPSSTSREKARNYSIAKFKKIDFRDEIEIKGMLNADIPIVVGMSVDDAFENLGYNEIYTRPQGRERGGHAMVVIGYDDAKQAYKLLNSWGTDFGTNGYAWVSYDAFSLRVRRAYTAQDLVSEQQNRQEAEVVNVDPSQEIAKPLPVVANDISVQIFQPQVFHNQNVATPKGPQPGMAIRIPGSILNGLGANAQLVVRFYMSDQAPLLAHPMEFNYRDLHGLVATGTQEVYLGNSPTITDNAVMYIPYYALNLVPTGYQQQYNLAVQVTVYINKFEQSKSPYTAITVLW